MDPSAKSNCSDKGYLRGGGRAAAAGDIGQKIDAVFLERAWNWNIKRCEWRITRRRVAREDRLNFAARITRVYFSFHFSSAPIRAHRCSLVPFFFSQLLRSKGIQQNLYYTNSLLRNSDTTFSFSMSRCSNLSVVLWIYWNLILLQFLGLVAQSLSRFSNIISFVQGFWDWLCSHFIQGISEFENIRLHSPFFLSFRVFFWRYEY